MTEDTETASTIKKFAALSHDTRLVVFRAVMRAGPAGVTAGALADHAGVSPSNLSAHLTVLTEAGLISVRPAGRRRIFAPNLDEVGDLVRYLVQECCDGHPQVCEALPGTSSLRSSA